MIQTRIIAHRGNSSRYHENTMPAFQQAVEDGADGIEFDVRLTRDRQWVVHHDAEVVTEGGARLISIMTLDEIREAHVGPHRDPIPTLAEFLEWSNQAGTPAIFDIKDTDGMPELIETVERAQPTRPPVYSSFHRSVLKQIEHFRPQWQRGLIVGDPKFAIARRFLIGSILRWSRRHRITSLHLAERWIHPSLISEIQNAGVRVAVWTVDDPVRITLLAALGVDGIITNCPDRARAALRGNQ